MDLEQKTADYRAGKTKKTEIEYELKGFKFQVGKDHLKTVVSPDISIQEHTSQNS